MGKKIQNLDKRLNKIKQISQKYNISQQDITSTAFLDKQNEANFDNIPTIDTRVIKKENIFIINTYMLYIYLFIYLIKKIKGNIILSNE